MIYQTFNSGDIVAGRTLSVASGFFNDGTYAVNQASLTTDTIQTIPFGPNGNYDIKNGTYYYNVYYNGQVHFSISYGDLNGKGSSVTDIQQTQIFPTIANYRTFMNLLLDPSQKAFSFLSGAYNIGSSTLTAQAYTGSSIFALTFESNLFKGQLNPGQISFALSGANGVFTFIDDSSVVNKESNVYNIISGAIDANNNPVPYTVNDSVPYQSLGLFYPKNGIIILNADTIDSLIGGLPLGLDSGGSSITYRTYSPASGSFALFQSCLFNSLVLAGQNGNSLYLVKSEFVPTTQYYVRVQNANFNYTNNPTFISDGTDGLTKGTIKIPQLRNNPTTYITTVGLYDSKNELVAVAKLSQPMPKSFDNEYLFKVNLAY